MRCAAGQSTEQATVYTLWLQPEYTAQNGAAALAALMYCPGSTLEGKPDTGISSTMCRLLHNKPAQNSGTHYSRSVANASACHDVKSSVGRIVEPTPTRTKQEYQPTGPSWPSGPANHVVIYRVSHALMYTSYDHCSLLLKSDEDSIPLFGTDNEKSANLLLGWKLACQTRASY